MESKWLEDYLALVKYGSFTKAAEARHITQPAFSRRIRALENWLGTNLVDRNAYPSRLTPAGEDMIEEIQQLLDHVRAIQRKANDYNELSCSIVVATQHSLSVSICPRWFRIIRPLLNNHHNLRVNAANMHDCIEQFLAGNSDLLLCYQNDSVNPLFLTEGLASASLGPDALVPVAAASHVDAIQLDIQENARLPIVGFPNDSFFGEIIQTTINQLRPVITFEPVYITAQSESVHELVRQGVGMAWLPYSLVALDLKAQSLRRLALPEITLDIRLYWRKTDERETIKAIVQAPAVLNAEA